MPQTGMCSNGELPREVYVLVNVPDGPDAVRAVLHEIAHARRYTSIAAELPFVSQQYGELTASEGFALLFDMLALGKDFWLASAEPDAVTAVARMRLLGAVLLR